jgi:hypothetical protein
MSYLLLRPYSRRDFERCSLRSHRYPRTELVLCRQLLERRFTDIDHHLDDLASEWEWRFI